VIKITTAENKEKQGIRESLIKSYEILEEKLNKNNETIKELEAELNGGTYQKKKREKGKNHTWSRRFSVPYGLLLFLVFNFFGHILLKKITNVLF